MQARSLKIEERQRPMPGFQSSLSDFTVSAGESVDEEIVLQNPSISLYCLDDASQQAIFVELPPDVDLSLAPFVYQTQHEQAQRLITVPYGDFHALAQTL